MNRARNCCGSSLAPFFASSCQPAHLSFKDLFRHAAWDGLSRVDAAEHWLRYRDNRNERRTITENDLLR